MAQIGEVADARPTNIGTNDTGNSQQLAEIARSGDLGAAVRFVRQHPGERPALESGLIAAGNLGLIYDLNQSVGQESAALSFQDRLRAGIVSNPDFQGQVAAGEVQLADVDALLDQPAIGEAARLDRFTGALAASRLTEAQADYAIRAFALGRDVALNANGTIAVGADGQARLEPVRVADAGGRIPQGADPAADPRSTAQIVADYARQFNTNLAELANSRFGALVHLGFEALSLAVGGPMKYLLMKVFERGAEHLFAQGVNAAAPFIASQFGLSNEDAAHVAIAGVTTASLALGARDAFNMVRNLPNSVQQVARHVQMHMVGTPGGRGGPHIHPDLPEGRFISRFPQRPSARDSEIAVGRHLGAEWQSQAGFLNGRPLPQPSPPGTRPNPRPATSIVPDFYNPRLNVGAEVKNFDIARNYNGLIANVMEQSGRGVIALPGHAAAERWLFIDLRGQAVGDLAQLANRINRDLGNGSVFSQIHFILDRRIARAI